MTSRQVPGAALPLSVLAQGADGLDALAVVGTGGPVRGRADAGHDVCSARLFGENAACSTSAKTLSGLRSSTGRPTRWSG